ncbi:hypothetical protein LE181_02925 [Streptomyces sp. SCA3-4]|uniref:hypothetical protein n=1 Tax=Streptomyces sichuanensis TaxID=2871810 RepID=UPI001CE23B1C|nr:hypothetical protein [Streptomyces sichuanensis]MCA6091123.1 hypothetical protein [Streptomyces sichuanensis]
MALKTSARTFVLAALIATPLWGPPSATAVPEAAARVAGAGAVAPAAAPEAGEQRCVRGGVVSGPGGHSVRTHLCASLDNAFLTVSAPARCERFACDASGTYRMTTRGGREVASGRLGTRTEYPGPGTYRVTVAMRARSAARGFDARGHWTRTITLAWPKPAPVHTITVTPATVRPGRTTTLTYTVTRRDLRGDSNARLGLIGEEGTGVRLSSADRQCSNPLTQAYPSTQRQPHVLDCALVNIQPGHPVKVKVVAHLGARCSTIISKMGYWLPKGQETYTGGMLKGPVVSCVKD